MESICLESMDACGKFGDLESCVRVAQGAVESNSSSWVTATPKPGTSYQLQRHRIPITTARIHDALTSEKEEDQHHDQCVAEVQEGRGCSCDVQFGDKEMNRVQKEIHCSTSASQEGTPPPMIILQLSKALKISETLLLGTLYNKLH